MPRRWKSLLAGSLLSALLLTGCEPGDPGSVRGPTDPSIPAADVSSESYTFVSTSPLSALASTVGLVGSGGGVLGLLGHTITVPSGAVTQPTLFSLVALPGGRI